MSNKISRQEEAEIPCFSNHNEAAIYFHRKYGRSFSFIDSECIDGIRCYFYHLIIDPDIYKRGQSIMQEEHSLSGDLALEFILSYQPIEIFEN